MPELNDEEIAQFNNLNGFCQALGLPQLLPAGFRLIVGLVGYAQAVKSMQEQIAEAQRVDPEIEAEYGDDCDDVANMLGKRYMDSISGLVGDAVMVGQTIDGTVEALLQPKVLADNKVPERHWVNIDRLSEV